MNIFIGVDLSFSGTGFVSLSDDCSIITQQLISSSAKDCMEKRLIYITDAIMNLLNINTTDKFFIFMEGLSFGSKGQSMLELGGLHYLLKTKLYSISSENISYETIPPTSLKKFITGSGQAKKELMLLKVYKKFGIEFSDNNICDAYCLARLSHFQINAK